jgi:hypothetical protein
VAVCLPAVAQSRLQFDIPFSFSVEGKVLPAGRYEVRQVFTYDQSVWRLSLSGHDSSAILVTNGTESPQKAHEVSMVFYSTEAGYSLAQFWPEEHSRRDLPPRWTVKSTVLADGAKPGNTGKRVEIAAK